jgi:hypothetical protein
MARTQQHYMRRVEFTEFACCFNLERKEECNELIGEVVVMLLIIIDINDIVLTVACIPL